MIPNFDDGVLGIRRDANALAVVAMTLGTLGKGSASELIAASEKLASADSKEGVKEAYQEIVAARSKTGSSEKLEWRKVAQLRPLMKNALPSLSTDIKRLARNEKTFLRAKNAEKVVDDSTIMVAIALGCRENVDETQSPDQEKIWREYCERLASAALDFNVKATAVAAKTGNFDEMKDAFKAIEETCNSTCHEKFGGKSAER
ncbi:MAG: cytochrome c [Thermoguttaceae bacterium]|nr:cytochrome c [Thermoguttaceae bacterium]